MKKKSSHILRQAVCLQAKYCEHITQNAIPSKRGLSSSYILPSSQPIRGNVIYSSSPSLIGDEMIKDKKQALEPNQASIVGNKEFLHSSDAGEGILWLSGLIPCLLMLWLLKSPQHQQAWYWLSKTACIVIPEVISSSWVKPNPRYNSKWLTFRTMTSWTYQDSCAVRPWYQQNFIMDISVVFRKLRYYTIYIVLWYFLQIWN